MDYDIPLPLKQEHEQPHARVRNATEAGGEAASALATLMHPHFVKEDDYALPPLGLLQRLA